MKYSFKSRVGFGVGLILLLCTGAARFLQTQAWETSARWITHTHEVIEKIDDIFGHSRAGADLARQYAQSGDESVLKFARKEFRSTAAYSADLVRMVGDNPEQRKRAEALFALTGRQNTLLSATAMSATRSVAALNTPEEAGLQAKIDNASAEMRRVEYHLLHERSARLAQVLAETRLIIVTATLSSVALVALAFWLGSVNGRKREIIERDLRAREAQYRQVVEGAGDMIYQTDANGRFTFCNQTALSNLHLSEEEVLGRSYLKIIRQDKRRDAERFYLRQFARRKKHTYHEFPIIDGHGRERWVGQTVRMVFNGGKAAGFQAIARDITERKKAEVELEHSRIFIERIAATTPGILYVYDLEDQRNIFSNRELFEVLGYKADDLQISGGLNEFVHPGDLAAVRTHHNALRYSSDGEVRRLEYRARHADGRWIWLSSRDTPFERNSDGAVRQIVGIAQDVTARRSSEEQLAYQANYDALTGLSNRHYFFTRLDTVMRRAEIEHAGVSVCTLDVDHFKAINDRHGHAAGDEVLQAIGQIVRSEMRECDVAARLGGDEFCFVLVGAETAETHCAAERVRERLTTMAFGLASNTPFSVTATFGIAELSGSRSSRDLLDAADQALYTAKRQGRNRTLVRTIPS